MRGLRLTVVEALGRGLISEAEAQRLRAVPGPETSGPVPAHLGARRKKKRTLDPQKVLWSAVERRWPGRGKEEVADVVPGRRFRADICFPRERLVVEVDGYRFHASLEAFKKDRARQNLLVCHGWRVLRFGYADVMHDLDGALDLIQQALDGSASAQP